MLDWRDRCGQSVTAGTEGSTQDEYQSGFLARDRATKVADRIRGCLRTGTAFDATLETECLLVAVEAAHPLARPTVWRATGGDHPELDLARDLARDLAPPHPSCAEIINGVFVCLRCHSELGDGVRYCSACGLCQTCG